MKKDNSFVKAGAILVVSGFVVKLLSAAYRIPLTRMMGASLMGRYSSVLNVFMPFFSFTAAGVVPAVSRFTAALNGKKDSGGIYFLQQQALRLYIPAGIAAAAAFLLFSRIYSRLTGESIFFIGAAILAPCIVMAGAETVFKGITQGKMNMSVTAKANMAESAVKTALGILLVYLTVTYGKKGGNLPVIACLVSVAVSSAVCFLYLVFAGRTGNPGTIPETKIRKRQLLFMSVPISASALTISAVNFFDTAVCLPIIKKLPYGDIISSFKNASFMGAQEISMYLFGIWQGMALTVFNLVPAVLGSVGAACMPVITRAQGFKDKTYLNTQTEKLFRITAFLSVPATFFIFMHRRQIVEFLFGTDFAQAVIASQLLAIIIPVCPLACFNSAFNAVINAHGRSDVVFKILVFASVIKCVVSVIGCSSAQLNIRAFAVSAAVFYAIIFIVSAIYVKKLGVKFSAAKIFLPAVTVSAIVGLLLKLFEDTVLYCLPLFLQLLLGGTVFCTAYMLVMFISGFTVDI